MRSAALFALLVFVGACGPCAPSGPRPKSTSQLVFGTTTEPDTLDPAFARSAGAEELVRLSFLELTQLDDNWQIVPSLAAKLPVVVETSTTFAVRWSLDPRHHWSNGTLVTTQDVMFGYSIEANDALEAVSHEVASNIARIVVESPQDFRVEWKNRYADYQAPEVHVVLPSFEYPKPTGTHFAGMTRPEIANGPYKLADWVPGRHAIFERNKAFGGPAPAIERIIFRFFPSEDALEAELLTGTIDALGEASGLSIDRAKALEPRIAKTHDVVYTDSGMLLQLALRLDDPVMRDIEVRHAISGAIDRQVLADLVYGGHAQPAYGLFPKRHAGFDPNAPRSRVDLTAAKTTIAVKGLTGREVSLQFVSDNPASDRAASYLRDVLMKIGLKVTLVSAPMAVVFERLKGPDSTSMTLFAFRMRPDWNGKAALTPGGRLNFARFDDPIVNDTIRRAEETLDPTKWGPLMKFLDRRVRETLPMIPLLYRQAVSVRPKGLKGWRPTGTTTPVTWNAESWVLTPN